jgi:hypothetical protein
VDFVVRGGVKEIKEWKGKIRYWERKGKEEGEEEEGEKREEEERGW